MREILGKTKSIKELLKGQKFSIDFYQREYKWQEKQIQELIDDLSSKFLDDYEAGHERKRVKDYGHYFLGSIIISRKETEHFIVDGQQRLTSLTLLLIYLRHLQQGRPNPVALDDLIFSEQYGEKSFNLDVPERVPCMQALFAGESFDGADKSESVQNMLARFEDITEGFPEDLRGEPLLHFIDWLIEHVSLVEITAFSDDDAYNIFETMNDRGLALSPSDMLKGYLLANINDPEARTDANDLWKQRVRELAKRGKDVDQDFFKAWLRSQYAMKIRVRKKGATPEDFDRIGSEFHRWLQGAKDEIGLKQSADFERFITRDFDFYSKQYLRILDASETLTPGLEQIFYNAHHGFTLQNMLLLAPLKPTDADTVIRQKLKLVAMYVDIILNWRIWNSRSLAYSTMQYAIFLVMREVRRLDLQPLALKLHELLAKEQETFADTEWLELHSRNRWFVHRMLARLTDWVEQQSGQASRYLEYVRDSGRNRYEVEHIWANKFDRHNDEFGHPAEFAAYRNRIGGLLLLPKKFNASYNDATYDVKLPQYFGQNLLAQSLHPNCYIHNPGFLRLKSESGLPFQAHSEFKKADLEERGVLYRAIAERIWDPDQVLREVGL